MAHDHATPARAEARPDYHGNSIANLVGSITAALGGEPAYAPLATLPPESLRGRRNIVLMVLDGLGYEFLARHPDSFLHRHLCARLTSVFPTTTASAITTYLTGLAPQQHGLTGWFTYLRELGSVATILPFRPRHGGPSFSRTGIEPRNIFDFTPLFDRLACESHIVSPQQIVDSDYSIATGGRAVRRGYRDLAEFVERIRSLALAGDAPKYIYAYWPELDSLAHQFGIHSEQAEQHFRQIDIALAGFMEDILDSDTAVVVCADHGFIDTAPERVIQLEHHPRLAETLTLPLCGEPRTAYCYVRPARRRQFEDYVRSELTECCRLVRAEELAEQGYFGLGAPHPRLADRIGDYVLLMRENFVIKDMILGETPFQQIGVHGGLSREEMYVPLIVPTVS